MQITDMAKEIINAGLAEEKCNGIRLHTEKSCCGKSLQFELVNIQEGDQAEDINGIAVLMDEETREWTGTVTVGAENGKLTLCDSAASCCGN